MSKPSLDSGKITLLRPYFSGQRTEPPLGIAYLAGYLETTEFKGRVNIIDCEAERIISDSQVKAALREKATSILGISFFTYDRFAARRIARLAHELGILTVAGGLHVSSDPIHTLMDCPEFDFGVMREGEISFCELLREIHEGRQPRDVQGVVWRDGDQIVMNDPRSLVNHLDEIPMPAYHLLPMHLYGQHAIMASRGCPNACRFCASPMFWQRKLRFRSPDRILDEIQFLLNSFGHKSVRFKDDTLTCRPSWAEAICSGIVERQLKLEWDLLARARGLKPTVVEAARRAGAYKIRLGVESGNERIRRIIGKNVTRKEVFDAVKLARDSGFTVVGVFFMIGLPEEKEDEIDESYAMALSLRADSVSFKPADIYPGTGLYSMATQKGLIPDPFPWFDDALQWRFPKGYQVYPGVPTYSQHYSREQIQVRSWALCLDYLSHKIFRDGREPNQASLDELGLVGLNTFRPFRALLRLARAYFDAPQGTRRNKGLMVLPKHFYRRTTRLLSPSGDTTTNSTYTSLQHSTTTTLRKR